MSNVKSADGRTPLPLLTFDFRHLTYFLPLPGAALAAGAAPLAPAAGAAPLAPAAGVAPLAPAAGAAPLAPAAAAGAAAPGAPGTAPSAVSAFSALTTAGLRLATLGRPNTPLDSFHFSSSVRRVRRSARVRTLRWRVRELAALRLRSSDIRAPLEFGAYFIDAKGGRCYWVEGGIARECGRRTAGRK